MDLHCTECKDESCDGLYNHRCYEIVMGFI